MRRCFVDSWPSVFAFGDASGIDCTADENNDSRSAFISVCWPAVRNSLPCTLRSPELSYNCFRRNLKLNIVLEKLLVSFERLWGALVVLIVRLLVNLRIIIMIIIIIINLTKQELNKILGIWECCKLSIQKLWCCCWSKLLEWVPVELGDLPASPEILRSYMKLFNHSHKRQRKSSIW